MVECLTTLRGNGYWGGIYGDAYVGEYAKYRGAEVMPLLFQPDLNKYVSKCSLSAYHAFGSAKIGNSVSDGSVVNSRLLVHDL